MQITETTLDLVVDILNDESPYQLEFMDRLEKEIVSYCDEYATCLARLRYLGPRIARKHKAYERLGGGSLREFNRLELAAPAPAPTSIREIVEVTPTPTPTPTPAPAAPPSPQAPVSIKSATAPGPRPTPAVALRRKRPSSGVSRRLTGNPLSLDEYVTFVHLVKQEFQVYPAIGIVARYYATDRQRVSNLKYQAVHSNRLPRFVNPDEQPGLLEKITATFGPYKRTA